MSPMRHPADGRVHLSELKGHAKSPAHVRLAVQESRKVTRPMVVGAVADCLVFGNRGYACYPGPTRNGKAWDQFRADHPKEIQCIGSELEDAQGAAAAVLADPVAASLLEGCEFQRVMQWEAYGLPCGAGIAGERGGFDAFNTKPARRRPYIADMKVTANTLPEDLIHHAGRMFWWEQGAWYLDGAAALCIDVEDFHLICVESAPPHNVTVLTPTRKKLDRARRRIRIWTEKHKACEAADAWPGYVQDAVEVDADEYDE